MSFFIPIVDQILRSKEKDPTPRTRAIVIYPMNALANSQLEELNKFLHGYAADKKPFTVERYTGQDETAERERIASNPPDILLTNFMMLELILTRYESRDRRVVEHCHGLEFLVLDELHTYRGRQGADVAMLVRRLRQRLEADKLICIGTSATMSNKGSTADKKNTIASVASKLFGANIVADNVIDETLERVTEPSKNIAAVRPYLRAAIHTKQFQWDNFDVFRQDPLAIWVELKLSIDYPHGWDKPERAKPLTLTEASQSLARDAGVSDEEAKAALQAFLLAANAVDGVKTLQGAPPFAFKLHQFISGPGKVSATLEAENERIITLDTQRFAPGRKDQGILLFPTHFCRECGQEYHPVWKDKTQKIEPRSIDDLPAKDDDKAKEYGFIAPMRDAQDYHGHIGELPETWFDPKKEGELKRDYKNAQPYGLQVDATGHIGRGVHYWGKHPTSLMNFASRRRCSIGGWSFRTSTRKVGLMWCWGIRRGNASSYRSRSFLPLIAEAQNKAERERRIQWLKDGMLLQHLRGGQGDPSVLERGLYREFLVARRGAEAASVFAHDSGRYPLTGVGDVNTYALFAETISQLLMPQGRAGFIVPMGHDIAAVPVHHYHHL